ncbi:MAG: YfhO family protein [Clostridiales bacterium]|nr:YfhO family protein [Clostridiales bacterium]
MRYLRKDNRITLAEPMTKVCLIASFFLPILVLLLVAYKLNIFPFSSNIFMSDSTQATYIPVVTELRRKILSRESLLYTWNAGGGSDFWARIASFAASPFVLIYVVFPEKDIPKLTEIIFALKVAFASLSFFILLWKKENAVSPVTVGISVAYSLCAYVLTYTQEPWMLDTVILLPLLILTLHGLILGKKNWAFSLVCALTGITCCKAGIYIGIFILIMFPLLYLEARHDGKELRKLRSIILDFCLFFFLGIGLSAFVWYPALQSIWKTVPGTQVLKFPKDLESNLIAWDFLERAGFDASLVFPADTIQFPSIYCGLFPVIMVFLYAFSSKIRFSEKIYVFTTMIFFYITMSSKVGRFLINGFHNPITGMYPQAILISFLVVYAAGRLLGKEIWIEDRSHLYTAGAIIATFMVIRSAISKTVSYDDYEVYIAIALIILYFVLTIQVHGSTGKNKTYYMSVLAAFLVLEAGISFYRPIKEKYLHSVIRRPVIDKSSSEKLVLDPDALMSQKGKKVYELDSTVRYDEPDTKEASFVAERKTGLLPSERVLLKDPSWKNYGLLYDLPTIASDDYLTSKRFSKILRALGLNRCADGSKILPVEGTPVSDVFFQQTVIDSSENSFGVIDKDHIFGSNGFFVSTEDIYTDVLNSDSPFDNQNMLAFQFAGVTPFDVISMEAVELENMTVDDDGYLKVESRDSRAEVTLESEMLLPSSNNPLYIYSTSEMTATVEVYVIDENGNDILLDRHESVTGECLCTELDRAEGRKLRIHMTFYSPDRVSFRVNVAILDQEKLERFTSSMKDLSFKMDSISSGSMSGIVNAPSAGNIVWSVSADKGWTATIDGEETATFSAFSNFLGVHVPEGTHEVKLSYMPYGMKTGAYASIGSLALILFLSFNVSFPKKKKEPKEESVKVEAEEVKEQKQ